MFIICTSLHLLQTTVLTFDILCWLLFYFIIQLWILTKTNMIFKLWSDLDSFNYIWVLALTTLKMATWVAETCLWPLCNKITSIKWKCFCWYFNICCAPVTVLELKMEIFSLLCSLKFVWKSCTGSWVTFFCYCHYYSVFSN
jgi:hypothetical protein